MEEAELELKWAKDFFKTVEDAEAIVEKVEEQIIDDSAKSNASFQSVEILERSRKRRGVETTTTIMICHVRRTV